MYFFLLLGSTSVKAAHKTLVKMTPGRVELDRLNVDDKKCGGTVIHNLNKKSA